MAKNTYESDLILGDRYKDETTGVEGTLVAVYFFQHACERGSIRFVNRDGDVKEATFDAPELTHIDSGETARSERPGGPDRGAGRVDPAAPAQQRPTPRHL